MSKITETYNHFMVDLETLGTKPDAAIVQIGIAGFQPTSGSVSEPWRISVVPHEKATMDFSTVQWWMGQSDEARKAVFGGQFFEPKEALEALNAWIKDNVTEYSDPCFWSKPSTFDMVILESLYRQCGMQPPWKHWNVCCLRTLIQSANMQRSEETVPRIPHDAGYDAEAQAVTAVTCHNRLVNAFFAKNVIDNGNA